MLNKVVIKKEVSPYDFIEKLPIIEKGYELNLNRIEEGYLYRDYDINCRASSLSKAKYKLLNNAYIPEMKTDIFQEELTYINIPVIRCKEVDLVEYKGNHVVRSSVHHLIKKEEHEKALDDIMADPEVTHCYIMKRGLYYRDNSCGYVESRLGAGIYTKDYACSHARNILELRIIPINTQEHNKYLSDHIEAIQKRMIPI